MRRVSKIGVLLAVALLVAGLAAPASAKKGGHPGAPSGTGLEVTVEPSGNMMWANSVGDEILFDITVTNTSGGDLEGSVTWDDEQIGTFDLGKNESWTRLYLGNDPESNPYVYTVDESDFLNAPVSEQSPVTVGTVTATSTGAEVTDSDDAVMTAYPIALCPEPDEFGSFSFGPNSEYLECSFTAEADSYWQLSTLVAKKPHGKSAGPGATVRDGVPGNWCMYGDPVVDGESVAQMVHFPTAKTNGNIVCGQGGAGGETIPVRNPNTFYLATWADNEVEATPCTFHEDENGTVLIDHCP